MLTAADLQDDFQDEIERLMGFFDAPPKDVADHYALIPNMPIDVLIGPDVESYIIKGRTNIFGKEQRDEPASDKFIRAVARRLENRDLLYKENYGGVFRDGNALEHLLKPSDPRLLPSIQLQADAVIARLSSAIGATAKAGTGHPHISFGQNGIDMLHQSQIGFTGFCKASVAGLLDFQENYPAFFIKPKMAERFHTDVYNAHNDMAYHGARFIAWIPQGGMASVRAKLHSTDSLFEYITTLEPRLSKSSPHMSVMLQLSAVIHGIKSLGQSMNPEDPDRHLKAIKATEEEDDDWKIKTYIEENIHAVQRDKKGYYYMLWQTLISLEKYNPFPDTMAADMMHLCIDEYTEYLNTPTAQARYNNIERDEIRASLTALEEQVSVRLDLAKPTPPVLKEAAL